MIIISKKIKDEKRKKTMDCICFSNEYFVFSLGYYGYEIYQKAPPVPDKIILTDNTIIFTGQEIKDGQNVWQMKGRYGANALARCLPACHD